MEMGAWAWRQYRPGGQDSATYHNRGFGGQCIKNPNYDPKKGPVVNSGIMLNSLGQPLHNPVEDPIIRGTQRKKPNQGRQQQQRQ
jgi:hypothetical protein